MGWHGAGRGGMAGWDGGVGCDWMPALRIARRPSLSGKSTGTRRSNRPGRKSAASNTSARLVAARTITPGEWVPERCTCHDGVCDAGACDAGACDAGACDANACDAGACDAGACDAGACDASRPGQKAWAQEDVGRQHSSCCGDGGVFVSLSASPLLPSKPSISVKI